MAIWNFFDTGPQLINGGKLNRLLADPNWNTQAGIVATVAGTAGNSVKVSQPRSQKDQATSSAYKESCPHLKAA